jgi:hypothetical protein
VSHNEIYNSQAETASARRHYSPYLSAAHSGMFDNSVRVIRPSKGETTMAQRNQRGWLKKEKRAQGETWVLFFRTTRRPDGKRVEQKIAIGLVQDFPEKKHAWTEVDKLHLHLNELNARKGILFGDLAQHYSEHELVDHTESIHAKAHTTVRSYERIIRNRLLPKWDNKIALSVEPLEVEQWLKDLKRQRKFANPNAR